MAAAWLDGCRFNPTLGGTTDFVVSSLVVGYQTPASAGAVNATIYKWRAESADLSQWEDFEGGYTVGTTTVARTTVLYNSSGTGTGVGQSGAGTKINFTTPPQVACVALKEDLLSAVEANNFSAAQQTQARSNINATANKAYAESTTLTTGTTTMAGAVTTVPQRTDGTQILTASITPTLSTSKLLICVTGGLTSAVVGNYWGAIFQGVTAAAIAAIEIGVASANFTTPVAFTIELASPGTSAVTFAVNVGNLNGTTNTWAINGRSGSARLGTSQRWAITIEEIK
jgi:hypothetical protein